MADLNNEEQNQGVTPAEDEGISLEKVQPEENPVPMENEVRAAPQEAACNMTPVEHGGVTQSVSDSACGNNDAQVQCPCVGNYIPAGSAQKVYAVGTIGYDFGTEARSDSFRQRMEAGSPNHPAELLEHLKKNPWDSSALIWTMSIHSTPVYAIAPAGPFAHEGCQLLVEFLEGRESGEIERISLPGIITGQTMLMNGQVVPVISPDLRGMHSWTTKALADAALEALKGESKKDTVDEEKTIEYVSIFLERVYYETENMGLTPQERALNFAATNALNVAKIFSDAIGKSLNLADIDVQKSPICRPGSDCQDVVLRFFDPHNKTERAAQMYRFTIDVSDVLPVTVGKVRSWNQY